jgi:hypothetical protein
MQLTTNRQGFAPATVTEAIQFSEMLANSNMVPKQYMGKPQDIMVCIQWGMEMGLAPMQALQNIAVINGKPSVYGDAMMALVQASPVCDGVEETIEDEGTSNPVAVCVARRKGRAAVTVRFSVEDAKRAGLWGKQGPWQAYPKRMLQMRARGFALRDAYPDVLKGLISTEEAQDYPEETKRPAKDITPRNPLDALAAPVQAPAAVEFTQPDVETGEVEIVDHPPFEELATEPPAAAPEPAPAGKYAIVLPGKDKPHSTYATLEEWQDAYETFSAKLAANTKIEPRDRMTKLRELREVNQKTIDSVEGTKKIRHISGHQQRIQALAATL